MRIDVHLQLFEFKELVTSDLKAFYRYKFIIYLI